MVLFFIPEKRRQFLNIHLVYKLCAKQFAFLYTGLFSSSTFRPGLTMPFKSVCLLKSTNFGNDFVDAFACAEETIVSVGMAVVTGAPSLKWAGYIDVDFG